MKKIFLILVAASPFFISCSNTKKDSAEKVEIEKGDKNTAKEDDDVIKEETTSNEVESGDNLDKLAAGICDCMSDGMNGLSSQSKNILIKASKSSNPPLTMEQELMKITDADEKQKVGEEFAKFGQIASGSQMQDCANKLEKKYHIDDKDPAMQKQLVKRLQQKEDCEVLAALMNIGFKQAQNSTEQ